MLGLLMGGGGLEGWKVESDEKYEDQLKCEKVVDFEVD